MDKLTTERLEELRDHYLGMVNKDVGNALTRLLAYEQAAKNPVAWVVGDEEIAEFKNGREVCVMRDCDDEQLDYLPLYAAPVLPKQPEHSRQQFESLCNQFWNWAEFDEINHDEDPLLEWNGSNYTNRVTAALWKMYQAAPAQPVIPDNDDDDLIQRISGMAKFLRDKGEIKTPVLIEAAISALSAQPVSEPYKLNGWISVDEKMPEDGGAVLVHQDGGIIFCAEAEHGWFYPDEFPNIPKQGREITHWMPLPAAPAQDSE